MLNRRLEMLRRQGSLNLCSETSSAQSLWSVKEVPRGLCHQCRVFGLDEMIGVHDRDLTVRNYLCSAPIFFGVLARIASTLYKEGGHIHVREDCGQAMLEFLGKVNAQKITSIKLKTDRLLNTSLLEPQHLKVSAVSGQKCQVAQ